MGRGELTICRVSNCLDMYTVNYVISLKYSGKLGYSKICLQWKTLARWHSFERTPIFRGHLFRGEGCSGDTFLLGITLSVGKSIQWAPHIKLSSDIWLVFFIIHVFPLLEVPLHIVHDGTWLPNMIFWLDDTLARMNSGEIVLHVYTLHDWTWLLISFSDWETHARSFCPSFTGENNTWSEHAA